MGILRFLIRELVVKMDDLQNSPFRKLITPFNDANKSKDYRSLIPTSFGVRIIDEHFVVPI